MSVLVKDVLQLTELDAVTPKVSWSLRLRSRFRLVPVGFATDQSWRAVRSTCAPAQVRAGQICVCLAMNRGRLLLKPGIELRCELAPDLPPLLLVDDARLGQVLSNLVRRLAACRPLRFAATRSATQSNLWKLATLACAASSSLSTRRCTDGLLF